MRSAPGSRRNGSCVGRSALLSSSTRRRRAEYLLRIKYLTEGKKEACIYCNPATPGEWTAADLPFDRRQPQPLTLMRRPASPNSCCVAGSVMRPMRGLGRLCSSNFGADGPPPADGPHMHCICSSAAPCRCCRGLGTTSFVRPLCLSAAPLRYSSHHRTPAKTALILTKARYMLSLHFTSTSSLPPAPPPTPTLPLLTSVLPPPIVLRWAVACPTLPRFFLRHARVEPPHHRTAALAPNDDNPLVARLRSDLQLVGRSCWPCAG